MTHRLRYAARSDRGLVRANNQDSAYAGDRLLVVADGMGGHAAGDLASRVVVASFTDLDSDSPGEDLTGPLAQAIRSGNEAIAELVEDDPDLDGMGTTVTAMLFDGDRVALAHVGDSRAYLYRDGVLKQLSHDDTFVQSLVDDGRITEEEAAHHPQRNLLLRALNGSDADPALALRQIQPGDRYMLCSDGLSSVVPAESIADALAEADTDTAADRLIELALVAGGPDNVTVIVADVLEVGARSTVPSGVYDPETTGPMKPIHQTQRMPRVPLPPDGAGAGSPAAAGDGGGGGSAGFDPDADDDLDDDLDDEEVDEQQEAAVRRRRRRFRLLVAAGTVVVLVGAFLGLSAWSRTQYYVGVSGGIVVIYRGLDGNLLGMTFSEPAEPSCVVDPLDGQGAGCRPIYVDDLEQAARDTVTAGIPAADLAAARQVIADQLATRLLPLCAATAPGGSTAPPSTTPAATTPTTAPATTRATPRTTAPSSRSRSGEPPRTRPTTAGSNRLRPGAPALTTAPTSRTGAAADEQASALALQVLARSLRQAADSAVATSVAPGGTPEGTAPVTTAGAPGSGSSDAGSTPCRVRR